MASVEYFANHVWRNRLEPDLGHGLSTRTPHCSHNQGRHWQAFKNGIYNWHLLLIIAKIFDANAFQENPLDFVLDIHVSNTLLGFFVVGNAYDSVFRWDIGFCWGKSSSIIWLLLFSRNERHIVFPKMLAQNCRDFSNTNTMYNKVYQILPLSKLWKKTGHFLPGLYITQIHVRQLPLFTGSRQGWNSEASSFRYDRVGEHQCLLSGGDSRTHTHTQVSLTLSVSLWLFSLPPLHFLLLSLIHHYLVEGHQCQILQS